MLLATLAVFAGNNVKIENKGKNNQTGVSVPEMEMVSVSGKVTDIVTGEVLTGVKITIEGMDSKTYTDFDGNFTFKNLKPGQYQLKASYISYDNKVIEWRPNDSKSTDIVIKLRSAN